MISLFSNGSAQTALSTLTAASKILSSTQNRVSTGYRINNAEDSAAYWTIATTSRSGLNAASTAIADTAKADIEGNEAFFKNLIDANNRGIGQLVDADLNEESAKLKALQVQEQLAIQALAIANSSPKNILRLSQE